MSLSGSFTPTLPNEGTETRVRPANQPLYLESMTLSEKVQRTAEKITSRAKRPDEIKASAAPIKAECVEAFKSLFRMQLIGDELILRGEIEGWGTHETVKDLRGSLMRALIPIRANLGNPIGLVTAVDRRVKDQANSLKQLDETIKQKQWVAAHKKLTELIEEADKVGLFVDPKYSELLYAQILDRSEKVVPQYLDEQKTQQWIPSLFKEFSTLRPDLSGLQRKLEQAATELRDKNAIRWNGRSSKGPDCIQLLCLDWQAMDQKVAKALSILQAIGQPAQLEINSLAADYLAARSELIKLVSEIIHVETDVLLADEVHKTYKEYLRAIPTVVSTVRAAPEEILNLSVLLDQFAARSPETVRYVGNYKTATSEYLSWKRRLTQRYLKSIRTRHAQIQPLNQLLDPRMLSSGTSDTTRIDQTMLTAQAPPDSVGLAWSKRMQGVAVTSQDANVNWLPGADPVFISKWHDRVCVEATVSRADLNATVEALSHELLAGPDAPPLTLEAVLAVHTATHGPYSELGGVVSTVTIDSLTDRLWHQSYSFDINGSMNPKSLHTQQGMPGLVRLKLTPIWLANDLNIWNAPPTERSNTLPATSSFAPKDGVSSTLPDPARRRDPAKLRDSPSNPTGGVRF